MLLGGLEIPLWVVLLIPAVTLYYFYLVRNYRIFKDAGIPGPKPYPFVGTTYVTFSNKEPMVDIDMKLFKNYGKFVGVFDGTQPVLMVYDADWLKEAFIKNYQVLMNRRVFKQGGVFDAGILNITGDHWKSSRKLLTPEFSSGKLKKMIPAIQKCDDVFVSKLREHEGEPVDIRKRTNLLTLDVISTTAFGLDTEAQHNENCAYAENAFLLTSAIEANETITQKFKTFLLMMIFLTFPNWLQPITLDALDLSFLSKSARDYFEQMCEAVLEDRKKNTASHDFLQNMADKIVEISPNDPERLMDQDGYRWTRNGLTKAEVIGNAMLFLLAGFRTTADSLLFLFYELAHHQEIQQKLYEEIMEVCDTEHVTIEKVNQLKYLEYCINETMRLYPQGFRFDRIADQDVTIRGIKVTKGTAVTAGTWVIHRDPEIWDNPESFEPERFSPERWTTQCASAYMPFGLGNRQCIGNRLALLEMKMTMVSTLKNFIIAKNDQTPSRPIKIKIIPGLVPEETIMVTFMER